MNKSPKTGKKCGGTPPKLRSVIRLDSQPLNQTYFTPEGYLRDRPVLTSTGIFEYTNADGSVRRELRLPEDVFDPESLKSYRGQPIIVTHDAGLITKDNVAEEEIGTILSEGYRSGNDVRAEIVIHDTDSMKDCGYRELSLGYNLDLEEVPGVWEGEPYDAIQRNIRINHLALVKEARAGEQARLNIDSRDTVLRGGRLMKQKKIRKRTTRADDILTPDELKKAVEEYKARRASRMAAKADEEEETAVPAVPAKAAPDGIAQPKKEDDDDQTAGVAGSDQSVEEQVQLVKDRRDRRDEEGDPTNLKEANGVIANQDEDIDILFDIIDTLLAQIAFDDEGEEEPAVAVAEDDDDEETPVVSEDCGDDDLNADDDDEEEENTDDDEDEENMDDDEEEEDLNADDDDDDIPSSDPTDLSTAAKLNADSIDRIVRERVQIAKTASLLNMDGLENIKPMKAKKTIIRAVKPGIRLDGKSTAYINALFDLSCKEISKRSRKDTMYQRRQMFNKDSRSARRTNSSTTDAAREKMIKRMQKTTK